MLVISKFYGIVIKIYFMQKEHNPPHLHAIYGEYMPAINIETLEVIEGDLLDKALKLVKEWILKNKKDIMNIWETQNFRKIEPLEEGENIMFHKIKNITPKENLIIIAEFENGIIK